MEIRIERLTEDNFNSHSLDNFIRHQVVTECLRNVGGNWLLLPISFVEEWSLESEPFRGMGVGRKLFEKAAGVAREYGAKKLYISAHSSKESQAAYKALGCVHAEEIIPWIADEEPFDVQLEYVL